MNVEQIIKNPPEKYEAFLYRFTNLENSKKYIGIHKGFVGDDIYILLQMRNLLEIYLMIQLNLNMKS